MRGWLSRARVRWSPEKLDELSGIADSLALHPQDRTDLHMTISLARHYGDDPRCRASLIALVENLSDRYSHEYDPRLGRAVDEIRGSMQRQRGRGVAGLYGEFRRGDPVCRVVSGGRKPRLQDGVVLEFEPATDHARRFGRMVGVEELKTRELTRWFLDEIQHGRRYGRPW